MSDTTYLPMNTNSRTPSTPSKTSRVSQALTNAIAARLRDENWDQRLGFLMHDVSRLRRTVFDDFMKPLNVTRSQWWVLAYLSRHDGMIQSDLASVLELGKAALGSLIDRLEASGLVRRGADESDRRAKRVYLSNPGSQLIKEMQTRSHEMSELILEGLSDDERRTLVDLLVRVKQNLLTIARNKD